MKLNLAAYKDKVHACWVGKNIGGTMGAPYEGRRELLDVKGYATDPNVILPNDDLDLQLVWLHAMELIGPYELDCKRLGEFWISYITPFWNEYGLGKTNMRHGMLPPLAGDYRNNWKDSNGAWIRTEIWASLAPACPEVAAKYAIEDAMVDHGAGEGTIAAAFVAAMQSAAFVVDSLRTAIDVGLAKIPAESRVAQSVRKVIACYESGISPVDARNAVLEMNLDIGDGWFEAPSNVAYTVLGLLYGEGDFKKSMILALNCGDDTDCTGATVGSTLGILGGMAAIPDDWRAHIGDDIVTWCLAGGVIGNVPKTCAALTERCAAMAPIVLFANRTGVSLVEGEDEIPAGVAADYQKPGATLKRLSALEPYQFEVNLETLRVRVTWDRQPDIRPNGEIGVKVTFLNQRQIYGNMPHFVSLRWILPDGFTAESPLSALVPHVNSHNPGFDEIRAVIRAGESVQAINRIALEVVIDGRCTVGYVPMMLLG